MKIRESLNPQFVGKVSITSRRSKIGLPSTKYIHVVYSSPLLIVIPGFASQYKAFCPVLAIPGCFHAATLLPQLQVLSRGASVFLANQQK